MRWPRWYPTRVDILGLLVALVVVGLFAIVVVRFPYLQRATGLGPDWDCNAMPKGEPACIKKPA